MIELILFDIKILSITKIDKFEENAKKTLLFLHIRDKLLKFAVKFETGMSANIKNMY